MEEQKEEKVETNKEIKEEIKDEMKKESIEEQKEKDILKNEEETSKSKEKKAELKEFIYMILDTSFFIKLTSLDLLSKNKYLTTQYIINEIKDKNARNFYELNKNYIEIKNPTKDSIKTVSQFAQKSNDLTFLSIADLSVMALAYETTKKLGMCDKLNKEPLTINIVDHDKIMKEVAELRKKELMENKEKESEKKDEKKEENKEEGKNEEEEKKDKKNEEIKEENEPIKDSINESNNSKNQEEEKEEEDNLNENKNIDEEGDDDDDDWITPENLYKKLDELKGIHETSNPSSTKTKNNIPNSNPKEPEISPEIEIETTPINSKNKQSLPEIPVFVHTADFTLQNVCMKMGLPIMGVDGMRIRSIKNYILKCTVCYHFIFDINRQFCDRCGYPYLMRIGYNIFSNGEIKINDKKPETRTRGKIFDLPAPQNTKKGTVYILSEGQMPKIKKEEINIDKILENYENFKELTKIGNNMNKGFKVNSSKEYKWGFPRQNPNIAKKRYNKKKKK